MKGPFIENITIPDVTVEDILRAEGMNFSERPPRPRIVELYNHILEKAYKFIRPRAIWAEAEITGCSGTTVSISSGTLTSGLLVKMAGQAQKLILFAMTIGAAVEEQISAYQRENNMVSALALDEAASTLISKGASAAMEQIAEDYRRKGLETTFPMGPGHSYWKGLEDLRVIFNVLKPELIGISLNQSNLMLPRKSVCMVIGVGDHLTAVNGKTHCDFCNLKGKCHLAAESNSR